LTRQSSLNDKTGQFETARATPVTYVHYALDVFPLFC